MTGHCNGGCQVGWTGAMCETGYHLTINNTHDNSHENFYIVKPLYKIQLTIIHYIIISWLILDFERLKNI